MSIKCNVQSRTELFFGTVERILGVDGDFRIVHLALIDQDGSKLNAGIDLGPQHSSSLFPLKENRQWVARLSPKVNLWGDTAICITDIIVDGTPYELHQRDTSD